ncbi:MAG TPA: P1 family peptidase, partial [Mycobacteriales bacterium]|nr:P1 family peptidase [Mycobacteriales bacterium]
DLSLPAPEPAEVAAAASGPEPLKAFALPPLATTIGAVITDARLDKAWCARLAGSGQDGLARAIRPAHTMFDGDTVFGLSVAERPVESPEVFTELLIAAADTFAHAIVNGVLAAESIRGFRAYRDLFPSVRR